MWAVGQDLPGCRPPPVQLSGPLPAGSRGGGEEGRKGRERPLPRLPEHIFAVWTLFGGCSVMHRATQICAFVKLNNV